VKIALYGTQPQIQIAAGLLLTRSSTIVYGPKEMKTSSVMLCVCPASLTTRRCILQTIYYGSFVNDNLPSSYMGFFKTLFMQSNTKRNDLDEDKPNSHIDWFHPIKGFSFIHELPTRPQDFQCKRRTYDLQGH